jgi:hypothetical protein
MPSKKTVVQPASEPSGSGSKKKAGNQSISKELPGTKAIVLKDEDIQKLAKAMVKELVAAIASILKK